MSLDGRSRLQRVAPQSFLMKLASQFDRESQWLKSRINADKRMSYLTNSLSVSLLSGMVISVFLLGLNKGSWEAKNKDNDSNGLFHLRQWILWKKWEAKAEKDLGLGLRRLKFMFPTLGKYGFSFQFHLDALPLSCRQCARDSWGLDH